MPLAHLVSTIPLELQLASQQQAQKFNESGAWRCERALDGLVRVAAADTAPPSAVECPQQCLLAMKQIVRDNGPTGGCVKKIEKNF